MVFARNEVALGGRVPGSKSLLWRDHYRQLEKSTKQKQAQLEISKRGPGSLGYIWQFWISEFGGPELSYCEIESWCKLTGISLQPFELRALVKISSYTKT